LQTGFICGINKKRFDASFLRPVTFFVFFCLQSVFLQHAISGEQLLTLQEAYLSDTLLIASKLHRYVCVWRACASAGMGMKHTEGGEAVCV
jgi:hypothetical protein